MMFVGGLLPPAGRKRWRFASRLLTKEVIAMTDYEMLSLVIAIIMLVLAALSLYKNDK